MAETKTFQLNIRITRDLERRIRERAQKSGRSITAETSLLLNRAMQLDDMLLNKSDRAFDLAVAYASPMGGSRAVVRLLLDQYGVTPSDLAAWCVSGNAA